MMLNVATAPTTEVLTTAEAKMQLRVDHNDEDGFIDSLIVAAREFVETAVLSRALITQTLELYLDQWPEAGRIALPRPPVQSVTSVTYVLDTGVEQTLSSSLYFLNSARQPGAVVLNEGESWPSETLRPEAAVKVTYVAGYGNAAADVPMPIRQAILLIVGDLYENRENTLIDQGVVVRELPMAASRLLSTYRIHWLSAEQGRHVPSWWSNRWRGYESG